MSVNLDKSSGPGAPRDTYNWPVDSVDRAALPRLLLIDDDRELCELVDRFLAAEGFEVDSVTDPTAGAERALSGSYRLVLLDVMIVRANGFDVLRRIRAASPVPVVMLTAKGDALDRILGLEIGADDYLPKPFDPKELAARIRAVLRRTAPDPKRAARAPILVGDLEIDPSARTARVGSKPVDLTTVEFDLLETASTSISIKLMKGQPKSGLDWPSSRALPLKRPRDGTTPALRRNTIRSVVPRPSISLLKAVCDRSLLAPLGVPPHIF